MRFVSRPQTDAVRQTHLFAPAGVRCASSEWSADPPRDWLIRKNSLISHVIVHVIVEEWTSLTVCLAILGSEQESWLRSVCTRCGCHVADFRRRRQSAMIWASARHLGSGPTHHRRRRDDQCHRQHVCGAHVSGERHCRYHPAFGGHIRCDIDNRDHEERGRHCRCRGLDSGARRRRHEPRDEDPIKSP